MMPEYYTVMPCEDIMFSEHKKSGKSYKDDSDEELTEE